MSDEGRGGVEREEVVLDHQACGLLVADREASRTQPRLAVEPAVRRHIRGVHGRDHVTAHDRSGPECTATETVLVKSGRFRGAHSAAPVIVPVRVQRWPCKGRCVAPSADDPGETKDGEFFRCPWLGWGVAWSPEGRERKSEAQRCRERQFCG